MVWRYVSRACRRDSASAGEEMVEVKYDFGGGDTGGEAPLACKVRAP